MDDNAPEFEKVGKVSILEDLGIGQQVVRFKANDKDDSTITYTISSGNGENKFQIDSSTGKLAPNISILTNASLEMITYENIYPC